MSVIFAIVFIALTVMGYVPGVYPFVVLSLLALLFFRQHVSARFADLNRLFPIGLVIIIGCSATLLPLPDFMVGQHRAEPFRKAETLNHRLSGIGVDTVSSSSVPSFARFLIHGAKGGLNHTSDNEVIEFSSPRTRRVWSSLTLNRAGTIRTLFLVAGFFSCFWFCAGSDFKSRRQLIAFLIILGSICALTGIISRCVIPQGKTILWLFPVQHGKPIGPFINRNHFAFLCALLIPPCLLFCTHKRPPPDDRPSTAIHLSKSFFKKFFFLLCGLSLTGGVIVSLSRSGFLVMVAGIIIVLIYSAIKRFSQAFTLIFIVCLIGIGVFLLPFKMFQDRISTLKDPLETSSAQTRLQVWKDGVSIWRKYPLFGAGSDAFRVVYPTQKTSRSRKGTIHAENEYIQILADNGLVGAGLVLAAIFTFLHTLFNGPRETNKTPAQAKLFTGVALAVLAACAVHACLDFGLRIPLNALTVACLLGCAYPAPPKGEEKKSEDSDAPSLDKRCPRFKYWVVLLLIFFALLTNLYWLAAWKMDQYAFLEGQPPETQAQAIAWAPTYWYPWYETGKRCLEMSLAGNEKENPQQEPLAKIGKTCVQIAASLNSSDYRIWMAVAQVAFQQKDFHAADQAARRVIELRPYRKDEVEQYLQTR